ncbi:MAG: class I SAM-dependent methyltransferase [Candidatus Omnitrophota bacterium]|jgi:SAM-dependent methyltransferase
MPNQDGNYWQSVVNQRPASNVQNLWRLHMKGVYADLLDRWTDNSRSKHILKTDLYDEAVTPCNLISLLQNSRRITGIDVSFEVAALAKQRLQKEQNRRCNVVVCDTRKFAFKSGAFDEIISNSTLDHFPKKKDIAIALRELYRILKPRGILIITLDNPLNPIVSLRNMLPYRLLKSLGLIQYYVGRTLSKSELIRMLELSGFKTQSITFIDHTPRLLVVWIGYILEKINIRVIKTCFHRILENCEYLQRTPLRNFTGNFVAAKAIKQ